eukprot:scaffold3460_cov54-Phaeocystis_antarctica.AAC.1
MLRALTLTLTLTLALPLTPTPTQGGHLGEHHRCDLGGECAPGADERRAQRPEALRRRAG